jgi:predicted nucleotidyltransferase
MKSEMRNNPAIRQKVAELAEKYHLSLVLLFGSQASGATHRESDVDIAVLGEKALTEHDFMMINYECTTIFGTDRVDIVNIRRAPSLLLRRITDEAVVLYDRTDHAFSALEVLAARRFAEAQPLYEITREKINAFLAPV